MAPEPRSRGFEDDEPDKHEPKSAFLEHPTAPLHARHALLDRIHFPAASRRGHHRPPSGATHPSASTAPATTSPPRSRPHSPYPAPLNRRPPPTSPPQPASQTRGSPRGRAAGSPAFTNLRPKPAVLREEGPQVRDGRSGDCGVWVRLGQAGAVSTAAGTDPIRAKRARIARLVQTGKRIGYSDLKSVV